MLLGLLVAILTLTTATAWAASVDHAGRGRMSATALELAHRSCADRGLGRRWQCGRLRVALDPRGLVGGSLNLAVARYRLGSERARHRPILLALPGGPGQSALPLAQQFRSNLPPRALHDADLVVMDPRGTGASGALDCPTIQRVGSASALSLADCARSLGPRARLYSTSATVADIEALRRALAAPRISIYAVSYGTYVAQRYALAHPHQVDRLLLDSAIPLSTDPTDHTILSSNARALRALCGGGHCQTVTTDVVSDFGRVATRLRHGPPFGPTITPGSGHPGATQLVGPGSLESLLLAGDYDPTLRAATPAALRAGARGDASLLAKLQATAQADELVPGVHSLSVAAYYAASCQDPSLPWSTTDPLATRQLHARALADGVAAGLPFDSSVVLSFTNLLTCAGWPWAHRRPARSARRGRGQAIPTLVVSGSQDTISPPAAAARLVRSRRGARLLIAPFSGHDVLDDAGSDCSGPVADFFAGRRVPRRCVRDTGLPPIISEAALRHRAVPAG